MAQCGGTLLFHQDGSLAACTEELAGRCCPGAGVVHAGGSVPCTAELGSEGCELCSFEKWIAAIDWDHVLRVVSSARTGRRCRSHSVERVAPTVRPV